MNKLATEAKKSGVWGTGSSTYKQNWKKGFALKVFDRLLSMKKEQKRVGKPEYTEIYESSILDNYDVNAAPYLEEYIKTVPVYERNVNVDVILKSTHPAPATLRGLSWEGDYSPRFYKRV